MSGIAQKYNCALRCLDWQQEQGFVSSLALGYNGIEIQRGITTSSIAIFIPFATREIRMDGQALYYGVNALSNNVVMAGRKKLKFANGMYLGSAGSGKRFADKWELINVFLATNDRIIVVDPMGEYAPLVRHLGGQVIEIALISPMDLQMSNQRRGQSAFHEGGFFAVSVLADRGWQGGRTPFRAGGGVCVLLRSAQAPQGYPGTPGKGGGACVEQAHKGHSGLLLPQDRGRTPGNAGRRRGIPVSAKAEDQLPVRKADAGGYQTDRQDLRGYGVRHG